MSYTWIRTMFSPRGTRDTGLRSCSESTLLQRSIVLTPLISASSGPQSSLSLDS